MENMDLVTLLSIQKDLDTPVRDSGAMDFGVHYRLAQFSHELFDQHSQKEGILKRGEKNPEKVEFLKSVPLLLYGEGTLGNASYKHLDGKLKQTSHANEVRKLTGKNDGRLPPSVTDILTGTVSIDMGGNQLKKFHKMDLYTHGGVDHPMFSMPFSTLRQQKDIATIVDLGEQAMEFSTAATARLSEDLLANGNEDKINALLDKMKDFEETAQKSYEDLEKAIEHQYKLQVTDRSKNLTPNKDAMPDSQKMLDPNGPSRTTTKNLMKSKYIDSVSETRQNLATAMENIKRDSSAYKGSIEVADVAIKKLDTNQKSFADFARVDYNWDNLKDTLNDLGESTKTLETLAEKQVGFSAEQLSSDSFTTKEIQEQSTKSLTEIKDIEKGVHKALGAKELQSLVDKTLGPIKDRLKLAQKKVDDLSTKALGTETGSVEVSGKIGALENEINALNIKLNDAEGSLRDKVSARDKQYAGVSGFFQKLRHPQVYNRVRKDIKETKKEIKETKREIENKEDRIEKLTDSLDKQEGRTTGDSGKLAQATKELDSLKTTLGKEAHKLKIKAHTVIDLIDQNTDKDEPSFADQFLQETKQEFENVAASIKGIEEGAGLQVSQIFETRLEDSREIHTAEGITKRSTVKTSSKGISSEARTSANRAPSEAQTSANKERSSQFLKRTDVQQQQQQQQLKATPPTRSLSQTEHKPELDTVRKIPQREEEVNVLPTREFSETVQTKSTSSQEETLVTESKEIIKGNTDLVKPIEKRVTQPTVEHKETQPVKATQPTVEHKETQPVKATQSTVEHKVTQPDANTVKVTHSSSHSTSSGTDNPVNKATTAITREETPITQKAIAQEPTASDFYEEKKVTKSEKYHSSFEETVTIKSSARTEHDLSQQQQHRDDRVVESTIVTEEEQLKPKVINEHKPVKQSAPQQEVRPSAPISEKSAPQENPQSPPPYDHRATPQHSAPPPYNPNMLQGMVPQPQFANQMMMPSQFIATHPMMPQQQPPFAASMMMSRPPFAPPMPVNLAMGQKKSNSYTGKREVFQGKSRDITGATSKEDAIVIQIDKNIYRILEEVKSDVAKFQTNPEGVNPQADRMALARKHDSDKIILKSMEEVTNLQNLSGWHQRVATEGPSNVNTLFPEAKAGSSDYAQGLAILQSEHAKTVLTHGAEIKKGIDNFLDVISQDREQVQNDLQSLEGLKEQLETYGVSTSQRYAKLYESLQPAIDTMKSSVASTGAAIAYYKDKSHFVDVLENHILGEKETGHLVNKETTVNSKESLMSELVLKRDPELARDIIAAIKLNEGIQSHALQGRTAESSPKLKELMEKRDTLISNIEKGFKDIPLREEAYAKEIIHVLSSTDSESLGGMIDLVHRTEVSIAGLKRDTDALETELTDLYAKEEREQKDKDSQPKKKSGGLFGRNKKTKSEPETESVGIEKRSAKLSEEVTYKRDLITKMKGEIGLEQSEKAGHSQLATDLTEIGNHTLGLEQQLAYQQSQQQSYMQDNAFPGQMQPDFQQQIMHAANGFAGSGAQMEDGTTTGNPLITPGTGQEQQHGMG